MLSFLSQARKFINVKSSACIVLGNESCDLDSAVSALTLAYFYQNNPNYNSHLSKCYNFIPILNIPKKDYPLKTEVQYLLQKNNITDELLIFKDELSEEFLNANSFILVDHHVSPWSKNCVAIFDHRPKDEAVTFPEKCEVHLKLVGSCATLVAELFINAKMLREKEKDILNLLRSTIVLDTVNFSELAARATPKDVEICSTLENVLEAFIEVQTRDELFKSLVKARSDISTLTASQLLKKDLKILISSRDVNIKIAIPGFPLLVKQFILKPNAEEAVKEFARENKCSVVLLMGMYVHPQDGNLQRDLGLINITDSILCESIRNKFISLEDPNLSIELYKDCDFMRGYFYKQRNIKITRKHIISVMQNVIDKQI